MRGRRHNFPAFKFAGALLAIAFCLVAPATTYGQKKKSGHYGTIKILSIPGGLPIEVDGQSFGQTTTEFRSLDLDAGLHRIVVTLPNGKLWTRDVDLPANRIKCITLNYRPGTIPAPLSPCPFHVNISAPSQVNEGEVITYTTDAAYTGSNSLRYTWTVTPSSARILSGEGTSTITVDSTGLAGQRIVASVVIDDGSSDPVCSQTVEASTFIPPSPPRESPARQFDTCSNCTFDDQKARLDNLAVELQNDPSTTAYIISYGGRRSRVGQADRLSARARDYIVAKRSVDSSRVVVMNGGFREEDSVELWVVPAGAKPPQARPTVEAGSRKQDREPARRNGRGQD
jgi:hypothetical protein